MTEVVALRSELSPSHTEALGRGWGGEKWKKKEEIKKRRKEKKLTSSDLNPKPQSKLILVIMRSTTFLFIHLKLNFIMMTS